MNKSILLISTSLYLCLMLCKPKMPIDQSSNPCLHTTKPLSLWPWANISGWLHLHYSFASGKCTYKNVSFPSVCYQTVVLISNSNSNPTSTHTRGILSYLRTIALYISLTNPQLLITHHISVENRSISLKQRMEFNYDFKYTPKINYYSLCLYASWKAYMTSSKKKELCVKRYV